MSTISENNPISIYDPKTSKPVDGCVLLVSRGREAKGNQPKKNAICASALPFSADELLDNFEALVPYIQDTLKAIRVQIVRDNESRGFVLDSDLSVSACISKLEAESRLSKESITEYFNLEANKESLRAAFSMKLRFGDDPLTIEQSNKLDQLFAGLRDKFAELAGSRTFWNEKEMATAKSYLEIMEDSAMRGRLESKIASMNQKKEDDLLETLGF